MKFERLSPGFGSSRGTKRHRNNLSHICIIITRNRLPRQAGVTSHPSHPPLDPPLHENRPQRNFCRRNRCLRVERCRSSKTRTEAEGGNKLSSRPDYSAGGRPGAQLNSGSLDGRLYKKLSYRRGTARCVVSIEILPIATQQCRNYLYDKS